MSSFPLRIAALIALACAAWPAAAALEFEQALAIAQQRSRQLAAQDSAAAAAREMVVAARQLPDPVLKAGIANLPVNGPDRFSLTRDFMTQSSISVMQEITRGDKLRARASRSEHEALAAEAGKQLALASLQRDTAIAWLDLAYQQRLRDLLVRQREEAALQVQAAEAAYRGNRGAQADVFAARVALAQLDDRIAAAERDVAGARTMLARWVGDAASQPLGSAPAMQATRLREEGLDTAVTHHPQIAQMLEQEAAAQADVDAAKANLKVDPTVEVMYSQRGPAYSNMLSVNVSVPLQWNTGNRQDREVAARIATLEQLRAQREEDTRAHVAELRAMLQQWRANRERLQRYERSLLPLASQRTQAALAAYRGASAPLNAVLDARRAEIDTRMELLQIELDTARLWARLNYSFPAASQEHMQ